MDEISGGSYARVDLGAPDNADWTSINVDGPGGSGTMDNASDITFPTATADWGNVSGVFLADNASTGAGSILMYGPLDQARDVRNGDTFKISANNLDLFLS